MRRKRSKHSERETSPPLVDFDASFSQPSNYPLIIEDDDLFARCGKPFVRLPPPLRSPSAVSRLPLVDVGSFMSWDNALQSVQLEVPRHVFDPSFRYLPRGPSDMLQDLDAVLAPPDNILHDIPHPDAFKLQQICDYVKSAGAMLESAKAKDHAPLLISALRLLSTFDSLFVDDTPNAESFRSDSSVMYFIEDISGGKESIPIPAINCVDSDPLLSFEYVTRSVGKDGGLSPIDLLDQNNIPFVICDCHSLPDRSCATEGCNHLDDDGFREMRNMLNAVGCNYDSIGRLRWITDVKKSKQQQSPMLSVTLNECNDRCPCPLESCPNRVLQRGITYRIAVKKMAGKGWGVIALEPIPAGSFVCEYTGEMLSERESESRGVGYDEYFFELGAGSAAAGGGGTLGTTSENTHLSSSATGNNVSRQAGYPHLPQGKRAASLNHGSDSRTTAVGNRGRQVAQRRRSRRHDDSDSDSDSDSDGLSTITGAPLVDGGAYPVEVDDDALAERMGGKYVIDARWYGNVGRFINHSCNPSLMAVRVCVEVPHEYLHRIGFFALRDIVENEELSFDYRYDSTGHTMPCHCGAPNCRKWVR